MPGISVRWHIWGLCLTYLITGDAKLPALTEGRPSYYTIEFGIPGTNAAPDRIEGDILMDFGTQIADLQYYFDIEEKNFRIHDAVATIPTVINCKTLFSPGTILYRQYNANNQGRYNTKKHREVPILAKEFLNQYPLNQIRSCCDPKACPEKLFDIPLKKALLFYVENKNTGQTIYTGRCDFCALRQGTRTCPNGHFASGYTVTDQESGFQLEDLSCSPCTPGTWNTCLNKQSCTWTIPSTGDFDVGLDIAILRPPPVGACFSCESANQWRNHYQNTSDPKRYTLPRSAESWSCAGGDEPPRACTSNDFTHSEDWSHCICKKGTYPNPSNSTQCLPCPAGHYCTNGIKTQCPDHYHQPDTGQTSCLLCASVPSRFGVYNNCEPNKQLQMCLTGVPGSQDKPLPSKCVECSKCRRLYANEVSGQVDCYTSYIKGGY